MKVLAVDDSIVFRSAITKALGTEGTIKEVRTASNGKLALDIMKLEKYDLITLDLEMPVMDGMETLKEIRKIDKNIPIIIFSAFSVSGAKKTLEALQLGANDFIAKNSEATDIESNIGKIRSDLIPRIRALLNLDNSQKDTPQKVATIPTTSAISKDSDIKLNTPDAVAIGCSTGGPDALKRIFLELNPIPNFPMFIVQHMPPLFTEQLAIMLTGLGKIKVVEAKNGMKVENGICYLAPGDFHMKVITSNDEKFISLNQSERVCFVRPAVDVLFDSLADIYNKNLIVFVLTGMGDDGTNGSKKVKEKGGKIIIQDRETATVWGMPGMVAAKNIQDYILPLEKIANTINNLNKDKR